MIKFVGDCTITIDETFDLLGKIKALIYARVSTADQVDKFSLSSQVDQCAAFAFEQFGYSENELAILVEEGESGDDPNRPALNNALLLLEKGVGKKLIVLHPDRLSRSLSLQTRVSEKIWGLGCDIEFVQFELDPNNPESVLMYNIQGSIAQYNKAKILANSKRGRLKKVQSNQMMGIRRIYGYDYDKTHDILIINEEEEKAIHKMVDYLLNQELSISEIAKRLSEEYVKAPLGNVWYQSTISKMLKNETYTGNFYYGKTEQKKVNGKRGKLNKPREEWMKIEVPAIIDQPTFDRIQEKIRKLTKTKTGRPSKENGLIRGIARCGRCGGAVSINSTSKLKDKTLKYYGCNRKAKKGYQVGSGEVSHHICKGRNWRVDIVDMYVWQWLCDKLKFPDEIFAEIVVNQSDNKKIKELELKKERFERLLDEKNIMCDKFIDLYASGIIQTKEALEQKIKPVRDQIDEVNSELERINEKLNTIQAGYDELETIKQQIKKWSFLINNQVLEFSDQKRFTQMIIRKIVLHDDNTIEIHTPWTSFNGEYGVGK
ncbi:recombinase family protein [Brevibacillus laterosporus]|uniref:recombinase family protein n=1 Tax=Brevibacillus laterosporus TaxID=1465 RepID=UPI0035A59424